MKIGDKLKDLEFKINDSNIIKNSDLTSKYTIIYFYPKDDTPGCTKEAIDFSSKIDVLKRNNISIYGISKDSSEKHLKFISKHDLKFNLITDEDGLLCEKFNVWVEKSMYGKKYMGIQRATFLIDSKQTILNVWRNVKVKNHADEVLDFILDLD
jgi:peroxiredoxin Q/BCP